MSWLKLNKTLREENAALQRRLDRDHTYIKTLEMKLQREQMRIAQLTTERVEVKKKAEAKFDRVRSGVPSHIEGLQGRSRMGAQPPTTRPQEQTDWAIPLATAALGYAIGNISSYDSTPSPSPSSDSISSGGGGTSPVVVQQDHGINYV